MATQLQYLGHSSFKIQSDYSSILIDPFFTGNPYACCTADDFIALDAMFITHGHFDHLKDAVAIAKSTECMVICGEDVAAYLKSQGVAPDLITVMNVGESKNLGFADVTVVPAVHNSQINVCEPALPDGDPRGYVIEVDRHKVYHAGDTMLFDGMKDLKTKAIDIALLPIGGKYTMNVDDAVKAVEMIQPREVIPMHFNTFPDISADPQAFAKKVPSGVAVAVLQSSEKETL
ncbi:MAG: metal-dependent hydrolase [Pyramidobacter sp.]|jgi:L-ascorbate metabolism protein UlaG (beta-lactamase superfamily)